MATTENKKEKKNYRPWATDGYGHCSVCGTKENVGSCYVPTRNGTVVLLQFCVEHRPETKGCVEDMSLPYLRKKEEKLPFWSRDRKIPIAKSKSKVSEKPSVYVDPPAPISLFANDCAKQMSDFGKAVTKIAESLRIPPEILNKEVKLKPVRKDKKRKKKNGRVVEL